ncbi:MAG: stage V sporulation protein AB [Clostridium sp.]|uniref:stage V sporulation protein AB n=1 Tax=Butyribacter sp. TaxID=2822465 RepID=UPI002A94B072|nr:stage V sporulation protein AB [Clostridium sp.]MDY5180413.1 stage V sporulation protein AB [Butyribacter sp.]
MDILQETALAIIGFAGGVSVAAGTFALITALGIIPRLASRMGVAEHVYKLESAIVLGGTIGSLLSVYHFPMRIGDVGIIIFGLFAGIFVGCLSMALAEAIRVFPVLCQRINLNYGIYLLIFMMAAGKALGTLYQMYFEWNGK